MDSSSLVGDMFDGFVIGVRACAASLSLLLLVRSVNDRIVQWLSCRDVLPMLKLTDAFVIPVRTALPERMKKAHVDYAPLVSALIILVFGLGVASLLDIVYSWIMTV